MTSEVASLSTEAMSAKLTSTSAITSTVRQAAASLIPYLLITPPFLPSEVKSSELNLRHNMLSITSEDADQYLVTSHSDQDVGSEVLSLLDQLRSLAESLHQEADRESSGAIKLVGKVLFSEPEAGKIVASAELGDQSKLASTSSRPALLSLHLKYECPETVSIESNAKGYEIASAWKYDNLLPSAATSGQHWSSAFPEVSSSTQAARSSSNGIGSVTADSYDTGSVEFESARDDSDDATADATPGEYHTDADDFWGGYDGGDDKSGANTEDGAKDMGDGETEEARAARENKEEQEYWDSYGGSEDSAPSMTPDDSGYSNDDTYEDSFDAHDRQGAFTPNLVKELPANLSPAFGPRRLKTPPLDNPLPVPSRPERSESRSRGSFRDSASNVPLSPRPDSPSEADFRAGLVPQQDRSHRAASPANQDDEGVNKNGGGDEDGSWNGSDDEKTENEHANRPLPSSRENSFSIAEVLPPRAPESVGPAQSTYETPNNMTLTELEQYYRNRNQESRATTKARRGGRYGEDGDDARSDASSNKSNIPDLDSFQLPSDLDKAKQYVDPIDALVMARPEVGLGDLSEMIEKKQKDEARKNRTVPRQASMETLKKLAEEQEAEEKRARSTSVTFKEGDSKGSSSASGFRNFLQMAPSTVFSLNQQEEEEEEEEEEDDQDEDDARPLFHRGSSHPGMQDRSKTFDGQAAPMPPPINLRYEPFAHSQSHPRAPPSLPDLGDLDSAELDRFVLPGRPRDHEKEDGDHQDPEEDSNRSGLFDQNGNSIDPSGQASFFQAASTIASTRPLAGSIAPPALRVGPRALEPITYEEEEEERSGDTFDANQHGQDMSHLAATREQGADSNRPSTPDSVRVGFAPDTLRRMERERVKRKGGEAAERVAVEEKREQEEEEREKSEAQANKWAEALERKREQQRQSAARRGGFSGSIRGSRGGARGLPITNGRGGDRIRGTQRGVNRAHAEDARLASLKSPILDSSQSLPDLDFDDTRSLDANDGDAAGDVDSTALEPNSSVGGGASVSPHPMFARNEEATAPNLAAQLKSQHLRQQRVQAQQSQRERADLQRQRLRSAHLNEAESNGGVRRAKDIPPIASPSHRGGNTPDMQGVDENPFDRADVQHQVKGVKHRGAGSESVSRIADQADPQANRMALVQATKARNDSVKEIMKGAWRMMATITATLPTLGPGDTPPLTEAEFLRVGREAVRDCLHDGSGDAPLSLNRSFQDERPQGRRNQRNGPSGSGQPMADIPPIRGMPRRGKNPQGVRRAEFQAERGHFERERERKDREMREARNGNGDWYDQDYDMGANNHGENGFYDDEEDDYGGSATEREY